MSTAAPHAARPKKIWMDGEFVDWDDAKIHVLSHTLHYGSGVFEGGAPGNDKGPALAGGALPWGGSCYRRTMNTEGTSPSA